MSHHAGTFGGTPLTRAGSSRSYAWNTATLTKGWHRVSVFVVDAADNDAHTHVDVIK